jgi:O-antigen/teichoic acid export membrane protein
VRRQLAFLLRDSFVYGFAGAVNRFVKVLLVPVVARAFPVEVFGAFDAVGVYVYALATLAILGLNSSVILFATRGVTRADPVAMRDAASTGLRMVVAAATALTVVVAISPGLWADVLLGDPAYASVVTWAVASAPFSAALIYALSLLQWAFRRAWYVAIALGSAGLTIGLSYVVAFHTEAGLTGLLVANVIGQATGAAAALYASRDLLGARWDGALARRMLVVGLPFAAIALAGNLIPSLDRIFLVQAHSIAEAGIYGMGQKIAALSALVLMGFQAAWQPFAFTQRDEPNKPALFGRVFILICTVVAFLTVALVVAAPLIARLAATRAYDDAAIFVGPLALSAGFGAVFFVVAMGSVFEGRTVHNLIAYSLGVGVTIALNLVLAAADAPPVGIAWANCLGQGTAVACMAALAQRVHPIPYPFVQGTAVITVAALATGLVGRATSGWGVATIVGAEAALAVACAAWVWFGVLDGRERARLAARARRP